MTLLLRRVLAVLFTVVLSPLVIFYSLYGWVCEGESLRVYLADSFAAVTPWPAVRK